MSRSKTRYHVVMMAATLAASLFLSGTTPAGSCSSSNPNIVATAVSAGTFNTLVAAVQAAGLEDTLANDGPFTVFAPSDEAFAQLPKGTVESLLEPENRDQLVAILTYHVASGRYDAAKVVAMDRIETLNGQSPSIKINGSEVRIGGAMVTATDIEASNGVIHVIDTVLMPQTLRSAGPDASSNVPVALLAR